MSRIKWKDFEVHHLIAIRGEMEEEFTKTTNKQGNMFFNFFEFDFCKGNLVKGKMYVVKGKICSKRC